MESSKLSASVFFDVVADASGPNEGHPLRIIFVHRREKCIYDFCFFQSAEPPQVDSQQKSRRQPEVRQSGVYHDIRKEPFTISFILCEQAPDIIQILHSPLGSSMKATIFKSISAVDEITLSVRSGENSTGWASVKTCSNPTRLMVN